MACDTNKRTILVWYVPSHVALVWAIRPFVTVTPAGNLHIDSVLKSLLTFIYAVSDARCGFPSGSVLPLRLCKKECIESVQAKRKRKTAVCARRASSAFYLFSKCFSPPFFQSALDFSIFLYPNKSTEKEGPCRRDAIWQLVSDGVYAVVWCSFSPANSSA